MTSVGAGGDAGSAIGDDALVERPGRFEALAQLRRRQKFVGVRVQQIGGGDIDAAGDVARAAVVNAAGEVVLILGQRVDRQHRRIADCREHFLLPGRQLARPADGKTGGAPRPGRSGFRRAAFAPPFLPAAVEQGGIVEADHAKEPPHPRRPIGVLPAVEDDARLVADSEPAHDGGELGRARRHARHRIGRVGQLGDDIDELRAGDVGAFEVLLPRRNRVTRFGIRIEADVDGAIDDAQLGQPEVRRQPGGFDEILGMRKARQARWHLRLQRPCDLVRRALGAA